MKTRLHGVMGSISGGKSDLGKNTSAVSITNNDHTLLIDSGTGIIDFFDESFEKEFHLLITHYHLDHIMGFPFIKQLFDSSTTINIYGPILGKVTAEVAFKSLFQSHLLPFSFESIKATLNYYEVNHLVSFNISSFKVTPYLVEHPGGSMTYCIESNNEKICILTDIPDDMDFDESFILFAKNSDIIIADSYFKLEELSSETNKQFGHASIESVIRIKEKSLSKKVILTHHKSNRSKKDLQAYTDNSVFIGKEGNQY